MAVSGRNPSDFKESLSLGSTEDFDICCDPCLIDGKTAEAKAFCMNCQQNVCKSCLNVHSELHHQVESKPRAARIFTHRKDINVKSNLDTFCDITGCAFLSHGKLVVIDCENNKVKIVDVKKQMVADEYTLTSCPFDVAVLPYEHIAVTLQRSAEIEILKTKEKLSTLRSINVNRLCYGIAYHNAHLHVVCQYPSSVLVLDTKGTVKRDIVLESASNETFRHPYSITISKHLQQIYISDWKSNKVVSFTLKGKIIAVYKNDELNKPVGMAVLEDGSLLVCCYGNGTVHHISADLIQRRKLTQSVTNAKTISYDSDSKTAYVGSCDVVRAFSFK